MKNTKTSKKLKSTSVVDPVRSASAKKASITRKQNQLKKQQLKWRISAISQIIFFVALLTLIFVGISHLVRAINLTPVTNQNGIPANWEVVTAVHPDTMTVPITFFDQNRDCTMFEFSHCNIRDKSGGWTPNIVKDTLGADGLPVPANITNKNSLTATSKNVTGHDPVVSTDNFYQWFHEVDGKSKKYERELTFKRVGNENKYTFGGRQIFPLDDVPTAEILERHNFHFTAHMQVPIKANLTGNETFDFSGDDDVWVFVNNQLVLDIGGVHTAIDGTFTLNPDGTASTRVYSGRTTYSEKTIDLGLTPGQVVNLDLFYAERNTSEANTLITVSDMEWLISASANIEEEVIENKLVQYTASLENRNDTNSVTVEKVAAHLSDGQKTGFIPLNSTTLSSSQNPASSTSWESTAISLPATSDDGFKLDQPITLAPSGEPGDTAYVRFYVAPEANDVDLQTTVSFYMTDTAGNSGIATHTKTSNLRNLSVIEPEYTVSFNSEGGSAVASQVVTRNLSATRPADPTMTKRIFLGWYLNDQPYDFDTPITGDITLTAQWEVIPDQKYLVAFDSDGGTTVATQEIVEHQLATEPADPTKDGYAFKGWKLADDFYDFDSEVVESITLVAQWEKVEFLVIFNPDGGSMVAAQTVHKGNAAYQPINSLRDGYTFLGWYLNDTPYNFATPVTNDVLLVAKWEKNVIPEPEPVVTPTVEPEPTVVPNPSVTPAIDQTKLTATAERLIYDQTTDEDPMVAFLPVLGAVSYAPNTGVMTHLTSNPLGNQGFSAVVLSQPFLIINLAVFSISFAIFYPLRKRKD